MFRFGRISTAIRRTPLGILLIAALLAMIGVGTSVAGVYLMIEDGYLTLWASIVALVIGPTILYLTYHIVRLSRWAWMALVCLNALMLISSVLRLIVSPSPISSAGEIVVELVLLYYLTRPRLRESFGRVGADRAGLTTEA